ncbi:MAG: hypothetical protein C0459_07830 [Chitinophaga sp.]|jgi:trimeric autotransporter adhesin|nr:hypothetical protein [Chitinophaga sp.]
MQKLITAVFLLMCLNCLSQTTQKPTYSGKPVYSGATRTAKKPGSASSSKTPATYPVTNPASKNIVYQYIDTLYPDSENHFPLKGNAGIGTNAPQSALEIKRSAGDTRRKNFLLQLSNEWSPNGQNEPSIMFSNGDNSSPANVSYWTVGARVSGDKTLNTPQTFKICFKAPGSAVEQEYLSVNSYEGRVKIGDVNDLVDGYKLYVEQGILTEKVKVAVKNSDEWYDNVFKPHYKLTPLNELEQYIKTHNHLPDVPSADEVVKDGIDLGKMNALLLKKIEENTLYIIELRKDLDEAKKQIEELKQNKKDKKKK